MISGTRLPESLNRQTGSIHARSLFVWLTPVAIVAAAYWFCLRWLFPGYFAPFSAFHVDFYDYAAAGLQPFRVLITRYPRPVSYVVMKCLAFPGFTALLFWGIFIALANILLTFAIACRAFRLDAWRALAPFALFVLLLFAHPQFYIEHRHDLPAEVSYLFLALTLLAWISFVRGRRAFSLLRNTVLVTTALFCLVLFAFAKETYFVSALCLIVGLALANRADRRIHSAFLAAMVVLEACSLAWNLHISGPFVNLSADATNTYKIDVSPVSVAQSYSFYLAHLLNPALVLLPLLGVAVVWRDRSRRILALAFLFSGLAVFVPHAVLPNHLIAEYAWAAAPLVLAPVLLVNESPIRSIAPKLTPAFAFTGVLAILVLFGPRGYRQEYQTSDERWMVNADRRGSAVVRSLALLQSIRRPARVLIVGLEDASIPWESGDFIRSEFGDRITWAVLLPQNIRYRRSSRLVTFKNPIDLSLADFDYVVTYNSSGQLTRVRETASIPSSQPVVETFVPSIGPVLSRVREQPQDPAPLIQSAQLLLGWGFYKQAEQALNEARQKGATAESTQRLTAELQAARASETSGVAEAAGLMARPDRILQPDGSGFAATELFWKIPDGVAGEIHVNAPDGPLFTAADGPGHARTGKWVSDGMRFYLQDVSGGKILSAQNTLAQVQVNVVR